MRKILGALLATAAVAAIAGPAAAANPVVTLSSFGDPDTLPAGEQLIANFNDPNTPDGVLQPGFDLTLNGATVGVNEGGSGYSGTIEGDPTHYLTIPGGASVDLTSTRALSAFSLFMGSPDTYNYIRFIGDNYDVTLSGTQFTNGDTNQSWDWSKRINFDFGGYKVNHIILSSTGNSFEVDNFAANVQGVPEPATWALMITGFGAAGAVLRRRRQTTVTLA